MWSDTIHRFAFEHIHGAKADSLGRVVERAVTDGVNLSEANFTRADLRGTNPRNARPAGAHLYGATLSCADL